MGIRDYTHSVEKRWKITAMVESLSWFSEFYLSRNATSSKSGSHSEMDIKTEKGRESERSFSPRLFQQASFGSFSKLSERVKHSVCKMTDKRNNENYAFVPYF